MTPADIIKRAAELIDRSPLGPEDGPRMAKISAAVRELTRNRGAEVDRCASLLANLRHSEARQFAKQVEDLVPAEELATFLARSGWLTLCQQHGTQGPLPLDLAQVRRLRQELGGTPSDLELHLREYRRRTLGQASLADRLAVLRRVASLDPRPLAWADDLKQFGRARLKELECELEAAVESGDRAALEGLGRELEDGSWPEGPAAELLERVRGALIPLALAVQAARQAELADQLREAHSALAEGAARPLLEAWRASARVASPAPDLAREVEAVAGWLRQLEEERDAERAFEASCAELEHALDDDAPGEELERLAAAALRHERELPSALRVRTASRLETLKRESQRGFALRLVAALGVLVLIGLASSASWEWHTRREEARLLVANLEAAVSAEDAEGAARLLGAAHEAAPDLLEDPAALAIRAQAEALVRREADRRAELQATTAALESASVHSPAFNRGLAKLASLAETPEERSLVQEWELRKTQELDRAEREATRRGRPELELARTKLQKLRERSLENPSDPALVTGAEALTQELTELQARDFLSEDLVEDVAATREAVERFLVQARALRAKAAGTEAALRTIRSTTHPTTLAESLRDFSQKFPDHPFAAKFARAADLEGGWRGLSEWYHLSVSWGSRMHVSSERVASARRSAVEAYLREHPASPVRSEAEAYGAYLQLAEEVLSAGDEVEGQVVAQLLKSKLLTAAHELKDKAGRRYYLLDPKEDLKLVSREPSGAGIYEVRHVVDAALTKKIARWRSKREGHEPKLRVSRQASFFRVLRERVAVPLHVNWELRYLELGAAVVDAKLDPVLAASLLRVFLSLAQQTQSLSLAAVEALESLGQLQLDVPWMNPTSERAKAARAKAREALKRMRVSDWIAERRARLHLSPRHKPVGVFLEGRVQGLTPGAARSLHVLDPQDRSLKRVGSVDARAVALDPGAPALSPGTLVFSQEEAAK